MINLIKNHNNMQMQQNDTIPIVFSKSIPNNLTDELINYCVENLKHMNLKENFSCERGFELPCKNKEEYNLVSPQRTKQLRFVIRNNNNIALRYKDGIVSWSKDEVEHLRYFIENFISNK